MYTIPNPLADNYLLRFLETPSLTEGPISNDPGIDFVNHLLTAYKTLTNNEQRLADHSFHQSVIIFQDTIMGFTKIDPTFSEIIQSLLQTEEMKKRAILGTLWLTVVPAILSNFKNQCEDLITMAVEQRKHFEIIHLLLKFLASFAHSTSKIVEVGKQAIEILQDDLS